MLTKKCSEFINELGSDAPVPGGGSAAALVGALGMALGTMVGELTSGKKKYAEYEAEISNLLFRSKELTQEFEAAVARDVEAFQPLAEAYRMPSETEEQKSERQEEIQRCLYDAAMAPMELAELCVKALRILDSYSLIGNKLAISDAGTGAAFCEASLKAAKLNVLINIELMKDETLKKELRDRIDAAVDAGIHMAEITYSRVQRTIE